MPEAPDGTEGGEKITIYKLIIRKITNNNPLAEPSSVWETEVGRAENAVCACVLDILDIQVYSCTSTHESDAHRQSGADQVLSLQSDKLKLSWVDFVSFDRKSIQIETMEFSTNTFALNVMHVDECMSIPRHMQSPQLNDVMLQLNKKDEARNNDLRFGPLTWAYRIGVGVTDRNLQGTINKNVLIVVVVVQYLVLCPKQYYLRLCVDTKGYRDTPTYHLNDHN